MEDLIYGSFFTWRVTSLLNAEAGPFDMFGKVRDLVGIKFDELSQPVYQNQVAEMIGCFWCCSLWVGLFTAIILRKPLWHAIIYSTGAIYLQSQIGGWSG